MHQHGEGASLAFAKAVLSGWCTCCAPAVHDCSQNLVNIALRAQASVMLSSARHSVMETDRQIWSQGQTTGKAERYMKLKLGKYGQANNRALKLCYLVCPCLPNLQSATFCSALYLFFALEQQSKGEQGNRRKTLCCLGPDLAK